MKYYKRHWSEDRGNAYAHWGSATYYYEIGDDLYATRQIEIYENGNILKHDEDNFSDEFGMLTDKPIDPDEFEPHVIAEDEFESVWNSSNRFVK